MKKISSRVTLTLIIGIGLLAVSGVIAYAAIINVISVGTLAHSEILGGTATVTNRTISFAPGEVGAWHYHPGPLFNVVTQGTVTLEDGCGGEQSYGPGQAFEEGGRIHRPKNLGSDPTFAYQTFVIPQGSPTTVNIPGNVQQCGPPRNVDECRHGGWANFTFPDSFANQWQCMVWVIRNR